MNKVKPETDPSHSQIVISQDNTLSAEARKKAAEIVRRCGIRDGLFKGPRTLNAVETIAYELDAARESERERCAKIAEAHKGSAAKTRQLKHGKLSSFPSHAVEEIQAEERGEDIATDIIARAIRNPTTQDSGSASGLATTVPDHGPAALPERCPKCGRKANSDFDQDAGGWFECDECNYQWSYQSSLTESSSATSASTEGVPERIWIDNEVSRLDTAMDCWVVVSVLPTNDHRRHLGIEYVRADLAGDQGEGTAGRYDARLTHSDHVRMQETLDNLPSLPADEEADAYLRGKGIIKKCEVCGQDATLTNEFVERLSAEFRSALNERDSLVKELNDVKVAEIHAAQRCLAAESQRDLLWEQLKSTAAGYHHASHTDRFEDCESPACVAAREVIADKEKQNEE